MTFNRNIIWLALSAVSSTALAQQTEVITVTANKVEETWLESAETIMVLDAEDIKERNIQSIPDLLRQIPAVSLYENYNGVIDINYRGNNTSVFEGSSPLVFYVDGIPLSNRNGISFDMNDVESVEIIRGPSGAVYGKNSLGGVINITTRQAQDETYTALKGSVGNVGLGNINGFATTSITEGVRVKVNGTYKTYDGDLAYKDQQVSSKNVDREESYYLNAAMDADISDNGLLKLAVFHDNRQYGYGYVDAVDDLKDVNKGPLPDSVAHSTFTDQTIKSLSFKASYEHSFEDSEFIIIGSSRTLDYNGYFECDHSDQQIDLGGGFVVDSIDCKADVEQQEYTLEARWTMTTDKFKWLAGGYAENFDTTNNHNGQFAATGNNLMTVLDSQGELTSRTLAAFGQGIWSFTPDWQWVFGGRLQQVVKSADMANPTMSGTVKYNGEETFNSFLPKMALSWQFAPQQNTYVAYNRGYLPGGFNYISNTPDIEAAKFDPQSSDEIELGYKFQDQDLMLNLNLFYMDIQDIQSLSYAATGAFTAVNIKGAISKGAELEFGWYLNEYFRIDGGLSFIDAKYKSGSIYQGQEVSDKNIENTPKSTGNLGLSSFYNNWFGRVALRHTGEKYIDAANSGKLNANQIWNGNVGYQADNWSASLWVENLTNEFSVNHAYPAVNNYARTLNPPRRFGLTLQADF